MQRLGRVGIVGCGLSGCGIARVAALAGYEIHVCETSHEKLQRAFENSSIFFKRQSVRGLLSDENVHSALARIHGTIDLRDLRNSDLVIEAVTERLDAKQRVLRELDQICVPQTIFVSHTSSLSITTLAQTTNRPERVAGLHFFHPIHILKLVEIVKTPFVSPDILECLNTFVRSLKKEPVTVADAPGFVINRLIVAHCLNAIRLLEAGIATKEDIDKAMQVGCNHPMGPFALMDRIGLDLVYHVAQNLHHEYSDSQYMPPATLKHLVDLGHLGKKTGQGFYTYPNER